MLPLGQVWMIGFFIAAITTVMQLVMGVSATMDTAMRGLWLGQGVFMLYSCYVFWRRREGITDFARVWLGYAAVLIAAGLWSGAGVFGLGYWIPMAISGAVMLYVDRELNRTV